jgi:putative flippase GtrA
VLKDFSDFRQLSRFLAVGAFVYLVYVGLYRIGSHWLAEIPALSLAFAIAISIHFILNNWIVFVRKQGAASFDIGKLCRFLLVVLINYIVSTSAAFVLLQMSAPDYIALAGGIALTTVLGFFLNRRWVFAADR